MEIAPGALNPAALAKLEAAADGIARVCFAIPPELVPLRSLAGLVDSAWMGTGPGVVLHEMDRYSWQLVRIQPVYNIVRYFRGLTVR